MMIGVFIAIVVLGYGPWECIGPEGGHVLFPVQSTQDSQKLWALSDRNPTLVYSSADAGANWSKISTFTNGKPRDMVVTTDGSLLVNGDFMNWTSGDAGRTWTERKPEYAVEIKDVEAHPTDPNVILGTGVYSTSYKMGFFRSTNRGASFTSHWINCVSGVYKQGCAIAISRSNPSHILIGGYSYSGGVTIPYLVLSTNGGTSFSKLPLSMANDEMQVSGVAFHPTNSNIMLAASFRKVHRSTDGGKTWTMVLSVANGLKPEFSRANPNLVTMSAFEHVYRSTNAGRTWTKTIGISGEYIDHTIPDWNNSAIAYTASTQGFFKSTNGAASWSKSNGGLLLGKITDMIRYRNSIYLTADDLGIYKRSATGTGAWQPVPTPLSCGNYCSIATNGTSVILALEGFG